MGLRGRNEMIEYFMNIYVPGVSERDGFKVWGDESTLLMLSSIYRVNFVVVRYVPNDILPQITVTCTDYDIIKHKYIVLKLESVHYDLLKTESGLRILSLPGLQSYFDYNRGRDKIQDRLEVAYLKEGVEIKSR